MDRLCFGTFARTLQSAMQIPNSNQAVVELLLDLVAGEASDGELSPSFSIKAKTVSGLMNFSDNVHEEIVALSSTQKVIDKMPQKFISRVILVPMLVDDLIENLKLIINADKSISTVTRNGMTALADREHLSNFLSVAYLYALNKSNKAVVGKYDMEVATEIAPDDIALLNKIHSRYPRPKEMVVPNEPTDEELAYITQLLEAYAEAAGVTELSRSALSGYPKYNNDLRQRRKEYYAAETIRRGTREVSKNRMLTSLSCSKKKPMMASLIYTRKIIKAAMIVF